MNAVMIQRLMGVALLLGIAGHRYATVRRPVNVEKYHAHIRDVAKTIPSRFDAWVGEDVRVPVQALAVLRPNVMISRRYLNVETGMAAGVVLVHCSDSHDMAGHFPLRCYPARGWDVRGSQVHDWNDGDLSVTGTEYVFSRETAEGPEGVVVANCLLRPRGKILRDMNAMAKDVVGAGGQSSGAGQLQVYFDARMPRDRQEAAVKEIIAAYRPVIDAILATPAE